MPKKTKPYNLPHRIVKKLREISRNWPPANECLKIAKTGKNLFRCEACPKQFRREYMRKDHIKPIGEEPCLIDGNWIPSWDNYINAMFSPLHNYQALCLDCHDIKTKAERRKKCRKS